MVATIVLDDNNKKGTPAHTLGFVCFTCTVERQTEAEAFVKLMWKVPQTVLYSEMQYRGGFTHARVFELAPHRRATAPQLQTIWCIHTLLF